MKLLAVTGKAGSGKDTVCEHLISKYGFTRVAFADPLKRAAMEMFGLTHGQCYDQNQKEVVLPFWGKSPRELLQLLGTEAGRNVFGSDIWIKRAAFTVMQAEMDNKSGVCVADCRFVNEAQFVLDSGGEIWRVVRPGLSSVGVSGHPSEAGIPDTMVSVEILNDGSLEDLYRKVDYLMGVTNECANSVQYRSGYDSVSKRAG